MQKGVPASHCSLLDNWVLLLKLETYLVLPCLPVIGDTLVPDMIVRLEGAHIGNGAQTCSRLLGSLRGSAIAHLLVGVPGQAMGLGHGLWVDKCRRHRPPSSSRKRLDILGSLSSC
jgi:hypothetical protein